VDTDRSSALEPSSANAASTRFPPSLRPSSGACPVTASSPHFSNSRYVDDVAQTSVAIPKTDRSFPIVRARVDRRHVSGRCRQDPSFLASEFPSLLRRRGSSALMLRGGGARAVRERASYVDCLLKPDDASRARSSSDRSSSALGAPNGPAPRCLCALHLRHAHENDALVRRAGDVDRSIPRRHCGGPVNANANVSSPTRPLVPFVPM